MTKNVARNWTIYEIELYVVYILSDYIYAGDFTEIAWERINLNTRPRPAHNAEKKL